MRFRIFFIKFRCPQLFKIRVLVANIDAVIMFIIDQVRLVILFYQLVPAVETTLLLYLSKQGQIGFKLEKVFGRQITLVLYYDILS